jgi:hypothetical protein
MAKARSGGGIKMNKNVNVGVRAGPPSTHKISRTAVMHLGNKIGSHITEGGDVKRPRYPLVEGTAPQVASGNALATNVGKGGPGKGRTIYKTGSQGTHGRVNPGSSPARRDTLAEYGSDMPSASMLKR